MPPSPGVGSAAVGQAKYVMADDGHKARVAPPWTEEKLKILDGYL